MPPNFINRIDEEISKRALKYESLHVEIFEFFEVVLHGMHSFENDLRQGLVYLSMVASGNDDIDSLSYFEFDVIIDIVEPTLPAAMRNTLFHKFAGAAFLKEGKKWEAASFADSLIEFALPLERLVAVYILQQYQIAEVLELKSIAVVKNAENLLDEIQSKSDEDGVTGEYRASKQRRASAASKVLGTFCRKANRITHFHSLRSHQISPAQKKKTRRI